MRRISKCPSWRPLKEYWASKQPVSGVVVCSAGGDGGRKTVPGRIANAKNFGWAIYAAGFAIWLFGYLSAGHAPVFDWKVATPWWISSFVPNLEAELGLALMFASVLPTLPWARLLPFAVLLVLAAVTLAWCGFLAWLIWHLI
jgi:hypothetical protein